MIRNIVILLFLTFFLEEMAFSSEQYNKGHIYSAYYEMQTISKDKGTSEMLNELALILERDQESFKMKKIRNKMKNLSFSQAKAILTQIKNEYFLGEKQLILGIVASNQNKLDLAKDYFEKCQKTNGKYFYKEINFKKLERNYLKDQCALNLARLAFKQKKYKEASTLYSSIEKKSIVWPLSLKERAWAHFKQGQFNRTLGVLATLRSPLFKNYYDFETEYLQARSYLELCQWYDAEKIAQIAEDQIEKVKKGQFPEHHFVDFSRIQLAQKKRQILRELEINKGHEGLLSELQEIETTQAELDKKSNKNLLKNSKRFADSFSEILLETYSRKRTDIYESKSVVKDRSRGSFSNIDKTASEQFWKFNEEFWADELGDYVFGLKSNCEVHG